MPQTRFVTRKALALGLRPIVVINKIDRAGRRAAPGARRGAGAVHRPRGDPRAARRAVPLYVEPRRAPPRRARACRAPTSRRCSRRSSTTCRRPGRSRGAVPDAGLDARLLDLPGADRDRADRAGPGPRVGDRWRCCRWASPGWWATRTFERQPGHQALHLRRAAPGRGARRPGRATSWRCPGFEGIEIGKTVHRGGRTRSGWRASRSRSPRSRWTSS